MNEKIKQWDEWFALVGMVEEWNVVKEQFPDDVRRQLVWAGIMELNRITIETDKKAEQSV